MCVCIITHTLETQLNVISSSSSMQVKVKRSESGPSCALWFLPLTSWASSASLQKCPWSIKVHQDQEPSDSLIPAVVCYSISVRFRINSLSHLILSSFARFLYSLSRRLCERARHVGLFLPGPQGSHGALPGASVWHRGPEFSDAHAGGRFPARPAGVCISGHGRHRTNPAYTLIDLQCL